MHQEVTIQSQTAPRGFNWSDFLSFRKMITLQVIQIVYIIVACLITLGGLIMLFSGEGSPSNFFPGGAISGLFLILFGNLMWRMWCELIIVFFRMNNTLSDINKNTGERKSDIILESVQTGSVKRK